MINTKLTQDLTPVFFSIWLVLMIYGFYKYYKNTVFQDISLGHFLLASFLLYLCGYITVAMIFGVEHLFLLPFMPFGISTLGRWYELDPSIFVIGAIAPFIFLLLFYNLLISRFRSNLKIIRVLIILLGIVLFLSGIVSFLYVLSWNIF